MKVERKAKEELNRSAVEPEPVKKKPSARAELEARIDGRRDKKDAQSVAEYMETRGARRADAALARDSRFSVPLKLKNGKVVSAVAAAKLSRIDPVQYQAIRARFAEASERLKVVAGGALLVGALDPGKLKSLKGEWGCLGNTLGGIAGVAAGIARARNGGELSGVEGAVVRASSVLNEVWRRGDLAGLGVPKDRLGDFRNCWVKESITAKPLEPGLAETLKRAWKGLEGHVGELRSATQGFDEAVRSAQLAAEHQWGDLAASS